MEKAPVDQGDAHDPAVPLDPETYRELWEQTQESWGRLSSPGRSAMALPLAGEDGWLFRDASDRWEQIVVWRRSRYPYERKTASGYLTWPDPRRLSPQGRAAGTRAILAWLLRNDPRFEVREEAGAILVRARPLEGGASHSLTLTPRRHAAWPIDHPACLRSCSSIIGSMATTGRIGLPS